ncbi:hypothetical protein ACQP1O_20470 [Nocardia sp. CA-151230]|uniref:hypothetical protein n=1 Tax=Nocardia sp. CA-151230 TaxID=3239982 RepID=UPI003D916221
MSRTARSIMVTAMVAVTSCSWAGVLHCFGGVQLAHRLPCDLRAYAALIGQVAASGRLNDDRRAGTLAGAGQREGIVRVSVSVRQ